MNGNSFLDFYLKTISLCTVYFRALYTIYFRMLPSCLLHLNTFHIENIGNNKVLSNFHKVSHVDSFPRGLSPTPCHDWVAQPQCWVAPTSMFWRTFYKGQCRGHSMTMVSGSVVWSDCNISCFAPVLGALQSWDPSLGCVRGTGRWFSPGLGGGKPLLVELSWPLGRALGRGWQCVKDSWPAVCCGVPLCASSQAKNAKNIGRYFFRWGRGLVMYLQTWADVRTQSFTAVSMCLKLHS